MEQQEIAEPSSAKSTKIEQSQEEGERLEVDETNAQLFGKSNPWAAYGSSMDIPEFDIYPIWRKRLRDYRLNETVIDKLEETFHAGKLIFNDLDDRALDALKYLPPESAVDVLDEFMCNNLEQIYNKSAYLCGIMRTHKMRACVLSNAIGFKEPDKSKSDAILNPIEYNLDVPKPQPGCEIFVGRIPKDVHEDELITLFESSGEIWHLKLIKDASNGFNRGFAFITYSKKESAQKAIRDLDGVEIRSGELLIVKESVPNVQLYVGNIPKNKERAEILKEFSKITNGLKDVIIYSNPDVPKMKNRGFCFLQYGNHDLASIAIRRLGKGCMKIWGCNIFAEWADQLEDPDEETMSKIKILYVSNLIAGITEDTIKQMFEQYGKVERVKKLRDYAFVHFEKREEALQAMKNLHKKDLGHGVAMSVTLAKPALESVKKEEMLINRKQRMMRTMQQRSRMTMEAWPSFEQPPESLRIRSRIQARNLHEFHNDSLNHGEPLYPRHYLLGSRNYRGPGFSMKDGFGHRDFRTDPEYDAACNGRSIQFTAKAYWSDKKEGRFPMMQRPFYDEGMHNQYH